MICDSVVNVLQGAVDQGTVSWLLESCLSQSVSMADFLYVRRFLQGKRFDGCKVMRLVVLS